MSTTEPLAFPPGADRSLLLVDDDASFVERLARAMEKRGFQARTAGSVAAARAAVAITEVRAAAELGEIICAVGLAQNVAAVRALASEGIQRGHMGLHARNVAVGAGATAEEIDAVATALVADGRVRADIAEQILAQLRERQ